MVKRTFVLVLIAACLLLSGRTMPAAAAENGQISGSLINRTAGTTSSVADQAVTLNIYQGNTAAGSQTTRTDQAGKYVFSGLSTDPSYVYQIGLSYQGADYYSQAIQFAAGETAKTADINVYDTTTSDEAVNVQMSYVVISRQNDSLGIMEYYLFTDSSDRAYIGSPASDSGSKRETLRFSLPPGATDLQTAIGLSDSGIIRHGNDFIDTGAVTPEGREISYSYLIPIKSNDQVLSWTLKYNVMRLDILSQDSSIQITSDKLARQNPLNINGTSYRDYAGQNLPLGDAVSIKLSGLTGSGGFNAANWAWLAILPLAGLAFFLVKRNKSKSNPAAVEDDRERLLGEIAALDDRFEDGEMDEEHYRDMRKQKKEQLLQLFRIHKDSAIDDDAD